MTDRKREMQEKAPLPPYRLQGDEFVIEQYNNARPFASFLPGVAGLYGKPLWAFYVNRGQCVASFGMNAKDNAIMEFYPATTAYRRVTLEGFRTFIKYQAKGGGETVYEPFRVHDAAPDAPRQAIFISPHEVRIEEVSAAHALRTEVVYYTVPGEDFPALAREVRIHDLGEHPRILEIIDGMPKLMPYGLHEWFMKHMSRTIEAWMMVTGAAQGRPFYRLRVDAADVAETKHITSGNFYLSLLKGQRARPGIIVDPAVVFGPFSDLTAPGAFAASDFRVPSCQTDRNITPSAFSWCRAAAGKGKTVTLFSLIGHASSEEHLATINAKLSARFFEEKRAENAAEISRIASTVSVFTGLPEFDAYTRQTNLDNILRGGLPIRAGHDGAVIYVFNRKHGDLERDYNNFVVQAEYFAQGNGNYRDANQNRRLSVWLEPAVGTKDIRDFYDLLQLDGYNPLVIKGDRFTVSRPAARRKIALSFFGKARRKDAEQFLAGEFTLGGLFDFAGCALSVAARARLVRAVAAAGECSIQADHGEGYWVDHWTYCLDLVESYLALFPEHKDRLLFGEKVYRYYDNYHTVKPHAEAVTIDGRGRVRRYHAVATDAEKQKLLGARAVARTWARTKHGKGTVYTSTLAAKMLALAAAKMATLDPSGIGIEMEADKPGWCDSLNGLPGLFGSSCCETFELARLIRFLVAAVNESADAKVALPVEAAAFVRGLAALLASGADDTAGADRAYWERANALKEEYRAAVRLGVDGKEETLGREEVLAFLLMCARKLERAVARATDPQGIPYTYFIHEAAGLDARKRVKGFAARPLPLFLEGIVHAFKVLQDQNRAAILHDRVRKSALYDRPLGMYKLNTSLAGESLEIGRSRAFTPGWLENESVWLHMEYKYLLEILRSGLYAQFFDDMATALIPFQDARRYGRSILENSSFLTSSEFFDKDLAGSGYYARLSGATVEFLHMLQIMSFGFRPFALDGRKLVFAPQPVLQKAFFTAAPRQARFSFAGGERQVTIPAHAYGASLFATTLVIYENPRMKDTFGPGMVRPVRFVVRYASGKTKTVEGRVLPEPFSTDLRNRLIDQLTITLE